MKEADLNVLFATCDHVLTTTMAELRLFVAAVTPAVKVLAPESDERRHLEAALVEMSRLHGYLLGRLQQLQQLGAQSGGAIQSSAPAAASSAEDEALQTATPDSLFH